MNLTNKVVRYMNQLLSIYIVYSIFFISYSNVKSWVFLSIHVFYIFIRKLFQEELNSISKYKFEIFRLESIKIMMS